MLALGSAATRFSGKLNATLNRLTRQVMREQPELPNRLSPPPGDARLRQAVAKRLSRYGSPVDPDAVVITAGTMEAIALSLGVLCREGDTVLVESPTYFGVLPVIEDDIYGDLYLAGDRPRPLSSIRREVTGGSVITCGSVSKTIAIGYRVGWAVSAEFARDIAQAKFCTTLACPALQQQVLARFLETAGYDRDLRQ